MTPLSSSDQLAGRSKSGPLPLIDPQELARRNNEATLLIAQKRRKKNALLNKATSANATVSRPLRAIGFFNTDRGTGIHDHRE